MRNAIGIVVACFLFPVALAIADDSVQVKYKFAKGDVLRYRAVTETRHIQDDDTAKLRWESKTEVTRIEVRDVDSDGLASIRATVESLRHEKCGSDGVSVYDSQTPRTPETETEKFMAVGASTVGVPCDMKLAPSGTVTIVNIDTMFDSMPAWVTKDPEIAKLMQNMRTSLKSGTWKPSGGELFPLLPTGTVKLGDHWETEPVSNLTPVGTVVTEGSSVLEGLETRVGGQRAHIAITERSTVDQSTSQISHPAGLKFTAGPGQADTRLVFDVSKGRVIRTESERVFASEFATPLDDQHRGPRKGRTVVTTSVSLIEVGKMTDQ